MHPIFEIYRMNYQQTLNYLFSQLPMYQRVGKAAYKADLSVTHALDEYFEHPHKLYPTIHVAGTNGKGSVSHMLASVLKESGYKVGLYTSPHLKDFRERIRINGEMVPEKFVVDFVKIHKEKFEQIKPSFFEMTVAMAFEYFAQEKVDIAVVEVGLGGRLDSTNIISPEISVITNIGLDHTDLLGDTIDKIAYEKAGIIKPHTPVVISQTQPEISDVFKNVAQEKNSTIIFADDIYGGIERITNQTLFKEYDIKEKAKPFLESLRLDLVGDYQLHNLIGVLATIRILSKQGRFKVGEESVRNGLRSITKNTGIMGRWQTIGQSPLIICDTGHNTDGVRQLVNQIRNTPHKHLHMIIGMVGDKNVEGILKMLPKEATYYFTRASIPRALDAEVLAAKARSYGLNGETHKSVQRAMDEAKKNAGSNDLIFIGGSTFVVADALI